MKLYQNRYNLEIKPSPYHCNPNNHHEICPVSIPGKVKNHQHGGACL